MQSSGDAKRLTLSNRLVVRWLYDAVFPGDSETPAFTKLRSILNTEVNKSLCAKKWITSRCWQISLGESLL